MTQDLRRVLAGLKCVKAGWAFGVPEEGRAEWLELVVKAVESSWAQSDVMTQNVYGEWVPGIPLPLFEFFIKRCGTCHEGFWTMPGYRGHYALIHNERLSAK